MTWHLPAAWGDDAAARAAWLAATPFPHLVVDDFIAPEGLAALMTILDDEAAARYEGDLFCFDATAPKPESAAFRSMRDAFGETLAPALARITGKPVTRVDMRGYAYGPGHYLLPHSDHQDGLERQLAFAYYLPVPEAPIGGELELYAVTRGTDGEYTSTTSARVLAPRPNRLVIFDVSDISLHQVREVLGGLRLSLAGWFYP